MVAKYPVPIQEDVRDLLGDLLGIGVAADKVGPLELADDDAGVVAGYETEQGEVGALFVCDAPFAIRVGAALVMVPASVAAEQLEAGVLDEQHVEFMHEVANIMSRLLNTPRTPRLRLGTVVGMPGELDEPMARLLHAPEFRRDFVVSVEGYGDGRVSLLVD